MHGLGSKPKPKSEPWASPKQPKTNIGKPKIYHKIGPSAPTQTQAQTSSSSQLAPAPPRAWHLRHPPSAAAAMPPCWNNCQRTAADAHPLPGVPMCSFFSSTTGAAAAVEAPPAAGAVAETGAPPPPEPTLAMR